MGDLMTAEITVAPAVLIIDLEVNPKTQSVFKIGAYRPDRGVGFESKNFRSLSGFQAALQDMAGLAEGAQWLMGHNILAHDLRYLQQSGLVLPWLDLPVIDTLRLSPLAFPQNPYHRLIKNHKIISSALNSPEADCHACWQLFQDQCVALTKLKAHKKGEFEVYSTLFGSLPYLDNGRVLFSEPVLQAKELIPVVWQMMQDDTEAGRLKVCRTRFKKLMDTDVYEQKLYIPLAYALSWLTVSGGTSVLAPWVRYQFPDTVRLIGELRDQDCGSAECRYCRDTLNALSQLQRYFKLPAFREVKGLAGGQRAIVEAGMKGGHVLAVLPTGGGKSLCFQLPALNRYYRNGGLTVVVSPLQSLMKDQVDNLRAKGVQGVDMLNSLLSVTERADVLDKVSLGDIGILFVAPEQFRNASFISAIEHRQINGWVFDEAHCLSKWGHDFRPDYLYAAKFIAKRNRAAQNGEVAPVSCLTATAKPDVLRDICAHFRQELGIEFRQFIGDNERTNLAYEVLEVSDGLKTQRINELLHRELDHQSGGAVVFVSRRASAETYAAFLKQQGWLCAHFHAGLAPNEKAEIQEAFIRGDLRVMVATNAFGMGVDKPDVRLVVHAEITGSLENYLQEAGRAGRDQKDAMCVLLFNREDVDAQFGISRLSQLELRDLKAVWRKISQLRQRHADDEALIVSGGEILKDTDEHMSFDSDDRQADTKIKTALAWLERSDLLVRTENQTRIFPSRSGRLTLEQALDKLDQAQLGQRKRALYQTILELVYQTKDDELLDTDDIGKATACSFTELRGFLGDLERLGVLVNDTRMTVNLRTDNIKPSEKKLQQVLALETKLWKILHDEIAEADQGIWQNLTVAAVCRQLREAGLEVLPADIKLLMYSLSDDKSVDRSNSSGNWEIRDAGNDVLKVRFKSGRSTWESVENDAELRRELCRKVLPFLIGKTGNVRIKDALAETSFGELKQLIADDLALSAQIPEARREDLLKQALLFMHKQNVIKLNHGMTILRHAMTIQVNPGALAEKRQYLKDDYLPLDTFYGEKRFQIHVMQEYALRALKSLENGWELVRDYFQTDEREFKSKWFKGRFAELNEAVSGGTLKMIADNLNAQQKAIVTDKSDSNRLVLAGPGSGKTRVIVHRVAYLLRVQHVNPAAVIVLTFNRLAAREIKRRLFALVGNIAAAVTVLTYDGMAMRLLGVRFSDFQSQSDDSHGAEGSLFKEWCRQAAAILSGSVEADDEGDDARSRIMDGFRYILVDEYQDISEEHYNLVSALAGRQRAEEDAKLTILAVGDDDQNIYAFNGTSNEYIHRFQQDYGVEKPDYLTLNYRSTQNIITAANRLIQDVPGRLKTLHPIVINPERQQEPNGGRWSGWDAERRGRVRVIELPPQVHARLNHNIQAQAVIAEIQRLQLLGAAQWHQIAVLARENNALGPLQAWCEQTQVPYFLSRDKSARIKMSRKREFVRLIEQLEKQDGKMSGAEFADFVLSQEAGGGWPAFFAKMVEDFRQEQPDDGECPILHSSAFLRNWLYEYVGNEYENRSAGLFLGTVHAAKGLEFEHVFVLDGGWNSSSDTEQRLYYVAMTRAKETLTLMCHTPQHRWIGKLPSETETVRQMFEADSRLDTEYRVLSLSELDMGFLVRDKNDGGSPRMEVVPPRLAAAKQLKIGDELSIRKNGASPWVFLSGGQAVARASRQADLTDDGRQVKAVVADFYVRYRMQEDEHFACNYPEKIERWVVVVPQLVLSKPADMSE